MIPTPISFSPFISHSWLIPSPSHQIDCCVVVDVIHHLPHAYLPSMQCRPSRPRAYPLIHWKSMKLLGHTPYFFSPISIATTYHLAHDFVCHVLFRKSSHNHGLWNLDANSSQEEPHGDIDLFLLRDTILWHVGNGPHIVLQQLWIWNCDDNAILHVTRREISACLMRAS